MKRRFVLLMGALACMGLTACEAIGSRSKGDTYWNAARKAESFEEYVAEHGAEFDLEALRQEAESAESTYSQKFKAVALLCAQEYVSGRPADSEDSWEDGAFDAEYPQSARYAADCLSKAAQGDAFWTSFEDAFWPHEYFWPLLAAAGELDGETVAALWKGIPDASYGDKLKDAVEQWVEENPKAVLAVGEALTEAGFYEDWSRQDWRTIYFHDYAGRGFIETDSFQEALDYVSYAKDLLPRVEEDGSGVKLVSDVTGEEYYDTNLMVAFDSAPELKDGEEGAEPESIQVEGKKVIALYRNLQAEELEGSPAPMQVIGDFMFGLPEGEFPSAPEEADYYLVLTPEYEYGEYYQTQGGSETKVQEVHSSTSVDLYDASTGTRLRHVGNILEDAPDRIFTSYDDDSARFPEVTGEDVLSYIYHNINTPDMYVTLLDNIAGKSQLEKEEPVILGDWEIIYHAGELKEGFVHGIFSYEPGEGKIFAKGDFTITNKSMKTEGFLPTIYTIGEDTIVQLVDTSTGEMYDCVELLSYGKCLNSSYLDPGETEDGELYFQVPSDIDTGDLAIAVSLGNRVVYYPF